MAISKSKQDVLFICLILFFIFRFVFVGISEYIPEASQLNEIGQVCSFCLTVMLIYFFRQDLLILNLDIFSILLIVICKLLDSLIIWYWRRSGILAINRWGGIVIYIVGISFLVILIIKRKEFTNIHSNHNIKKLLIGIGCGILLSLIYIIPTYYQYINYVGVYNLNTKYYGNMLLKIVHQGGYAASFEEPIFRAFLWGYLAEKGIKAKKIVGIQALLFIAAHYYFIPSMWGTLIINIPIIAIVLGICVYKTKSIATSFIAHAIVNGARTEISTTILTVLGIIK